MTSIVDKAKRHIEEQRIKEQKKEEMLEKIAALLEKIAEHLGDGVGKDV